jgi:putative hydrolase
MARRFVRSDPRATLRAILRGDLPRLLAGPEQAQTLDRLQAAMAMIEGHAEHVMDAALERADAGYGRLRERLEARRARRGGLGEVIARLLGLDLKMRQYQLGKSFCDAVVAQSGVEGLNGAWRLPEALPTLEELERPSSWLARSGAAATSAAA